MKIRLADFIADFLVDHGISECFSVVGGGAMHLNDALGHKEGLHTTYQHHEQACAIAAEGYARLSGKPAALCVTTGPGGTNAITGVLGGWLDSIPMFVLSGQVRYDTTARYNEQFTDGYPLRAVGDQEFDITRSVDCMCKYAVMLEDPKEIRYVLEKAYFEALNGRPGPVWIDVPVNYQGMEIETDVLRAFEGSEEQLKALVALAELRSIEDEKIDQVLEMLRGAKRPVIYAGNGIRLAGAEDLFLDMLNKVEIPICTYWDCIDLIPTEHPLYVGRAGNMGDRPGNFAVQNADLILAIGNRLSIRSVGYNWKTWAREAKVIMVDIDPAELRKPTLHVDLPICGDAGIFLSKLMEKSCKRGGVSAPQEWRRICENWKRDYPVVLDHHKQDDSGFANAYAVFDKISQALPVGSVTVTGNGTCCVAGHQSWFIRKNCRFLNNNAVASMGYGLPAAIGACRANDNKAVICLEGDGSIMMNLQELQTVMTNRLPVKIFLINNRGYHSIRQTQNNLFSEHSHVGIGPESGDLGFPDFYKIAGAFGVPYYQIRNNGEADEMIARCLKDEAGPVFCEIFVSTEQMFEPKNAAFKKADGSVYSAPLEDLAPFLPREELKKNLYITPLPGELEE